MSGIDEICPSVYLLVFNFCDKANLTPRKEKPAAQLRAFKHIVHLTTRAFGLRRMFLTCKHIRQAGISQTCISQLWRGPEPIPDHPNWKFYLEFAAYCICDEGKLGCLVETKRLDELVYVPGKSGEYSVIEQLLVASKSW
jgi:hypothetical protein